MQKDGKNKDIIDKFVEQLEALGLEVGSKLDRIEEEKKDFEYFKAIEEEIEESKIGFCSSYFALSEEDKKNFQKQLLELFKDQEIVDNIIQEIINLYYLQEANLLDLEEVYHQKEIAYENLETLLAKIKKLLQDTNIEQLEKNNERLSNQLDRLVLLGTIIEGEEPTPVDDIDYLREVLELVELDDEEKRQVLITIIEHNIDVYKSRFERKKENKPVEEEIEELHDTPTITKECMDELEDLLSQKDVIERIVNIIDDEFTTVIDIHTTDTEERMQIDETIDMAKEEIVESMAKDRSLSPEEALNEFFKKYDEEEKRSKRLIDQLTSNVDEELGVEEQQRILEEAYAFLESHRQYLIDISKDDKEKVRKYMLTLYQNKEDRKQTFDGIYSSRDVLEREVAYEIQIYKNLLKAINPKDAETISKVCVRLKEILDCITLDKSTVKEEKPHLFFLTDDEGTPLLEGTDIPPAYYKELANQLLAIEDRGNRKLAVSQHIIPEYRTLKKAGVRYTTGGTRTKIFFIPVGTEDSIIVSAGFITGKDNMKEPERLLKRYSKNLDELKERVLNPETRKDEETKALQTKKKIFNILNKSELYDMMEDKQEEKEEVKII